MNSYMSSYEKWSTCLVIIWLLPFISTWQYWLKQRRQVRWWTIITKVWIPNLPNPMTYDFQFEKLEKSKLCSLKFLGLDCNLGEPIRQIRPHFFVLYCTAVKAQKAKVVILLIANIYSCMSLYMRWPSTNFYTFSFFSGKSSCALVTRGEMVISPRARWKGIEICRWPSHI